jgi:DNA primase
MSDVVYDITDDVKRDVLVGTDLVALIGATTSLKKAGRSWKGLCPFHGEKTPSFHVHPEKGFYYCFGCGAKGDAITFVRETERLEFPEAVAYLARLAGITLPVRKSGTRADRAKETRVSEAVALAAAFFRDTLPRHEAASALVKKRGLTTEEAAGYGFGAAPDSWDALMSALAGRVAEETLVEAGLLQKNPDTGRIYDRFRNRLTIEIRDARGEILGFGARALGDEQPKYLNSPESNRFSKGKLLYGLDRAREAIRKTDSAILVEGYFDRIAMEKAGCAQAVASMGTALTPAQADLLARQAGTVVVAYDGDAPGQAAAWKAFPLLLARGAAVRHFVLPDGHDPDSYLAAHGAEALRDAVTAGRSLLSALLSAIPSGTSDPAERAARINEAAAILREARDPVLRHEFLSALSGSTGVPLRMLSGGESPTGPGKKKEPPGVIPGTGGVERRGPEGSERRVLEVLFEEWPESGVLVKQIPPDVFLNPIAKEVLSELKRAAESAVTLDFSELQSHLGPDAGVFAAELLLDESDRRAEKEGLSGLLRIHIPLLQLKIRLLEERAASLQPDIQRAEASGNPEIQRRLSQEKQAFLTEVTRLKAELKTELRRPGTAGARE